MKNNMVSIPEAASYSAVSRWTIWKYVRSGELKAFRTPGGHYRILKTDLENFMRDKGMYSFPSGDGYRSKKILIVDDEPRILDLLKKMLSKSRYQIDTASNGFEAGIKVLQFKPDIILLDLFMPGMDGFEVSKKIKESPETASVKILVMTGFDSEENRARIMAIGVDGYMLKPLDMEALQNNIQRLLNRQKNVMGV